jgi:hypothetical protein
MTAWMPSAEEERCRSLAARGLPCESTWRSYGAVVSALFFILTLIAVVTFYALARGVVTAVVAIATAEWLIRKKRFFGTGVEAALWIGGPCAMLLLFLPHSGRNLPLFFAAVFAVAGARVRSALSGLAATLLVMVYLGGRTTEGWVVTVASAGIALFAAIAMTRVWRRPSAERLLAVHVVVMPVAALLFGQMRHSAPRVMAAALFFVLTALLLAIGIRWRDRIVLVAAVLASACGTFLLHESVPWRPEAKLIAAGVLLVAIAAALSRALRGRTEGFVLARAEMTGFDEAIQIAGAIAAARPQSEEPSPPVRGGGGGFGGAGATGEF